MSTLKVAAINHPSASSGGLAIAADGNVSGAGLDLITSQSFTAVSSVSVNNCFTSAYDEYLINFRGVGSALIDIYLRLRSAGVDNSSSVYSGANTSNVFGATSISKEFHTNSNSMPLRRLNGTYAGPRYIRLSAPALADYTQFEWSGMDSNGYENHGNAQHAVASAFDGFTIYPDSGTITGSLRVYGYRN